jgi:prepilin-type N-terminal cleavage/methylation domain-containing protein
MNRAQQSLYISGRKHLGFTLLEMSIVITIVGLLIAGVLTGRELINAATIRSQIVQIESYRRAVGNFQYRFNAMPGDINAKLANQYGFAPRGPLAGEGDGNGILEGAFPSANPPNNGRFEGVGETVMFWSDLSYANGLNLNLIDGNFSVASTTNLPGGVWCCGITPYSIDQFFPKAKIGNNNFVYVYSFNGVNYYGLSANVVISGNAGVHLGVATAPTGNSNSTAETIPVALASAIDKKLDDGLPQSGSITATYVGGFVDYIYWTYDYNNPPSPGQLQWYWAGSSNYNTSYTNAVAGTTGSCFDNDNTVGKQQHYSLEINKGAGANCALSFRF